MDKYNKINRSACIKKYFNSSTQTYYDIGNENFKCPKMAHGTYNPKSKFYNIAVEKMPCGYYEIHIRRKF